MCWTKMWWKTNYSLRRRRMAWSPRMAAADVGHDPQRHQRWTSNLLRWWLSRAAENDEHALKRAVAWCIGYYTRHRSRQHSRDLTFKSCRAQLDRCAAGKA